MWWYAWGIEPLKRARLLLVHVQGFWPTVECEMETHFAEVEPEPNCSPLLQEASETGRSHGQGTSFKLTHSHQPGPSSLLATPTNNALTFCLPEQVTSLPSLEISSTYHIPKAQSLSTVLETRPLVHGFWRDASLFKPTSVHWLVLCPEAIFRQGLIFFSLSFFFHHYMTEISVFSRTLLQASWEV